MAERRVSDGPYMWATKSVLNRILNNAQGEANNAQGLHVYWSLCWIASNEQSDSFDCKVTHIAQLAGYRYRTAHAALGDLEKLGVIQIERTKGSARGPSRYTLLGFKAAKRKSQGEVGSKKEGQEKGSAENDAQPRRKF